MVKIKLNLQNKTVEDKISEGGSISTLMKADANPKIVAAGTTMETETGTLDTKNTERTVAQDIAKSKTTALTTQETTWNDTTKTVAAKVMEIYPNNPEKWKALGWEVSEGSTPVGELPAPSDFSVTEGDNAGELDLHWDRVKGASNYNIRTSTDISIPVMQWNIKQVSKKSSATIVGLTSGTKYWVAVTAFGTAGESAPTPPISKVAP